MPDLLVDASKCLGCCSCELACAVYHSASRSLFASAEELSPSLSRIRVDLIEREPFPVVCHHCEHPPCVDACMSSAMHKPAEGLVLVEEEKCVGCWMCVMVCPFGAVIPDKEAKKALKCDKCPEEEIPWCVSWCPTNAISFVEAEDLIRTGARERARQVFLPSAGGQKVEERGMKEKEQGQPKPECGFGTLGICCQDCSLGPCRFDPFSKQPQLAKCGLSVDELVMRNYLRRLALGASSFAAHARRLAQSILSRRTRGKAVQVARQALEDLEGTGERTCTFLGSQLSPEQRELLAGQGVSPPGIERAILEVLYYEASPAGSGALKEALKKGIAVSLAGLAAINAIRAMEGFLPQEELSLLGSFCRERKVRKAARLKEMANRIARRIVEGRGLAFVFECQPATSFKELEKKLLQKNISVVVLGCAGDSLSSALHLGDCLQTPLLPQLLSMVATRVEPDILLTVVLIPGRMNPEMEMIALALAALGLPVCLIQPSPVLGSARVKELLTTELRRRFGGYFIFGGGDEEEVIARVEGLFRR